jgi:hypothetical protein
MATLLRTDRSKETLQPVNGINWTLPELQTLVGGYIEIVGTKDGRYLVIDEEGKLKRKPLNVEATKLYRYGDHDAIVGIALLVDTKLEMDGPDDDDELEEEE